jgi:hypothetical protein
MFRSIEAKVLGNGFSVPTTCGHMSFVLPSTHLLCLRESSRSTNERRASCLTASIGNETPRGALRVHLSPYTGIPTLTNGGWHKQLRANPNRLILRLWTLSLRGTGLEPRFRLTPGARAPRTRVLISVLLSSMEKGRSGQLGPRGICIVTSCG